MEQHKMAEAESEDATEVSISRLIPINQTTESLNRQAYEDRLLSFKANTYYAKPACISPIVCSRFGWRNAETDMLACSSCKEAICISFIPYLSAKSMEKLCSTYRQQLATLHDQDCPFYMSKEQFTRLDNGYQDGKAGKTTVPSMLVSVLPSDCVSLMEHPMPISLLRKRAERLERHRAQAAGNGDWHFPELEFAEEIMNFSLNDEDGNRGISLFSNAANLIGAKDTSTAALSILGWIPIENENDAEQAGESSIPVVSLGCPICLCTMELSLRQLSDGDEEQIVPQSEEEGPPEKRRKLLSRHRNPLSAHRFFCPYVCGFPKTISANETPIWQLLLRRINQEQKTVQNENKSVDDDSAFERIRKMLRMAIVPKTVILDDELEEATIEN